MLTVAQTTQNIWNFMVGKSSLQEMATLAIIREISNSNLENERRSKIWSLPDYPGELIALRLGVYEYTKTKGLDSGEVRSLPKCQHV